MSVGVGWMPRILLGIYLPIIYPERSSDRR